MKKYVAVPAVLLSAVGVAACGSSMSGSKDTASNAATTTVTKTATVPDPPAPTTTTTSTTSTNTLTGPVGTPYTDTDAQNNEMTVVLTKITDPAQGATPGVDTASNGKRLVAAEFKISGMSGTFQSDANNDAVVIGSNGQTYNDDYHSVAGCTNFSYGEYTVMPGRSVIGCVTFQVPNGVKVASIQWGGQFGEGTPATWTN